MGTTKRTKALLVIVILLGFALITLDYFIPSERQPYIKTKHDELSYLVDNSDFIAVINVYTGSELTDSHANSPQKAEAKVEKVIYTKTTEKLAENITISSFPFIKRDNVVSAFMALSNGRKLAFVVKQNDELYAPTTINSLMHIYSNKLIPVWKLGPRKIGDIKESSLLEVENEIKAYIAMQKDGK